MAIMARMEAIMMEMERATLSWGMVRLKRLARSRPLYRLKASENRIARFVVLIPPPHEPGEAPTNMRMMRMKRVALLRSINGSVLKPAVRLVTDWKYDMRICPPMGNVRRLLFRSIKKMKRVPMKISTADVVSTTFA